MASSTRNGVRAGALNGGGWCKADKRFAVYCRDGMACVWCGASIEDGTRLSLDHVIPHSQGGSNHESNLVTACFSCNSSRGARSVEDFAAAVAGYIDHDVTALEIVLRISVLVARPLAPYRVEAKEIMARRVTL